MPIARPGRLASFVPLLAACLLALACQSPSSPTGTGGKGGADDPPDTGGASGQSGAGGRGGAGRGGQGEGGQGGAPATPDASIKEDSAAPGGSGGAGGSGGTPMTPDASAERPPMSTDTGAGDAYPESDHLPGRPDLRICKKEWTQEQCCAFLCSCLNTICADSPKAKPGIANCMSWCPNIGSMAVRCHVYHCYVSISPTGGIKDHDSHCGHAAHQVGGGSCPREAY